MASNSDNIDQTTPPNRKRQSLVRTVLVAIAIVLALLVWLRFQPMESLPALAVGKPAPPIQAAGWINGEAPTKESLRGKVIVIDAWASWCGPCRYEAPKLVKTYEKFRDRPNLVFIGLTSETAEELPNITAFLDEMKIPWLNGYGAEETLTRFEAYAIPSVWVIDGTGTVVWNFNSREPLETAIKNALEAVNGNAPST